MQRLAIIPFLSMSIYSIVYEKKPKITILTLLVYFEDHPE